MAKQTLQVFILFLQVQCYQPRNPDIVRLSALRTVSAQMVALYDRNVRLLLCS